MAFKINTSRLNDALRMLANFYMQNKLYEMSSQRQMGYLSEQDRLIRERQAEEDVRSRQANVQKYNLDLKLAGEKGIITALGDSNVKGLVQAAKIAANQGDMKRAKSFLQSFEESSKPFVKMAIQARTGETPDEATVAKAMEAADPTQVIDLIKEGGTESRFGRKLPIEQKEAETSRMQADLAREKFEAEPKGTQKEQKEYYQSTSTMIQKTMDNINSIIGLMTKQEINPYDINQALGKEQAGATEKLIGGAISAGNLAKTYMNLGKLQNKAMTSRLTPQELDYIAQSMNVFETNTGLLNITAGGTIQPSVTARPEETAMNIPQEKQSEAGLARPQSAPVPMIRKFIKDLRTGEEYWIILRNGQWMRE